MPSAKSLKLYIRLQKNKNVIQEINQGNIDNLLPSQKNLSLEQAKLYLQDSELLTNYQNTLQILLREQKQIAKFSKENISSIKSNLSLFTKACQHLGLNDRQYQELTRLAEQVLCMLDNLNRKNFFNSTIHYYEPLILELKDYLKSLKHQDSVHHFYARFLHFFDPISLVLLGTKFTNQKNHLACYTATRKLIELLEYNTSPAFSAEERTQFYKGTLGEIIEKYHIHDKFLDEHTKNHLPIQK